MAIRRRFRQGANNLSTRLDSTPRFDRKKFVATCEIGHRRDARDRFMMHLVELAESREIAMSMTAYFPFAEAHAGARGSRSKWSRFLDAMIEARKRKAEEEVARYVRHHWYEFPPQIRVELANRG